MDVADGDSMSKHRSLSALAARQHGLVTLAQAASWALARTRWHGSRAVGRVGARPPDRVPACRGCTERTAGRPGGDAVGRTGSTVSHASAGVLWGIDGVLATRVELWVPRRLRSKLVRVHQGELSNRDRRGPRRHPDHEPGAHDRRPRGGARRGVARCGGRRCAPSRPDDPRRPSGTSGAREHREAVGRVVARQAARRAGGRARRGVAVGDPGAAVAARSGAAAGPAARGRRAAAGATGSTSPGRRCGSPSSRTVTRRTAPGPRSNTTGGRWADLTSVGWRLVPVTWTQATREPSTFLEHVHATLAAAARATA